MLQQWCPGRFSSPPQKRPGNEASIASAQGGSDKVEMSHDIPRKHARGIRNLTHAVLTPHIHSNFSVEVLLLLSLLATAIIHGMLQYMLTRFH